MTQRPEKTDAWRMREIEARAARIIDPHGHVSEEHEAFRGTAENPDEDNRRAVRAREFADEPRFAAAMETSMDAYAKAVSAISEWLLAREQVDETFHTIKNEERLKQEVTELLVARGYSVAPDANFTFTYRDGSQPT